MLPSRNSSRPGWNSSSSVIRRMTTGAPTTEIAERDHVSRFVSGARNRVAVRTGRRVTKKFVHGAFYRLAQHVFPAAGFVMRLRPRQLEDISEEAFGQTMAADDALGEATSGSGQTDLTVGGYHELFSGQLLDHFTHRRSTDFEPFGDPWPGSHRGCLRRVRKCTRSIPRAQDEIRRSDPWVELYQPSNQSRKACLTTPAAGRSATSNSSTKRKRRSDRQRLADPLSTR